MNIREKLKRRAADAAVEQVRSGMVLGLGSGTDSQPLFATAHPGSSASFSCTVAVQKTMSV
jgi:ribose 5-phosphate isomerase